jgi:PEGA domain
MRPLADAAPWRLSAPRASRPPHRRSQCSPSNTHSAHRHASHRLATLATLATSLFAPLLAVLLVATLHRPALAQPAQVAAPSALVVFGRADQSMQDVVYAVVDRKLRDAGWPLVPPLASNDATIVRGCLSKAAPWPCLESMTSKKGIERIVAVRVDLERSPDGTSQVVLTGRLIYSGAPSKIEQKRYCGACSKEDLTAYGEEISNELLAERALLAGNTKIAVSSTPMGAEVRIDNKPVGVTNNVFATSPGKHTVEVRAPGHQSESREVSVNEGKTVTASFQMRPGASPTTPPGPPLPPGPPVVGDGSTGGGGDDSIGDETGSPSMFRKWGPKAMVGVGGALVVTGAIFAFVLDEPKKTFKTDAELEADPHYKDWTPPGIAFMASGAILAGVGGYLWWKWMPRETAPAISSTRNSVVMGLSGSF